ncbi:unnamed protein product [Rhizophagus irregularis]|nr:unnamed protein product [Rhizophagus irregularis]
MALQDLSGTSVSHIEPNRDIETLVDQENLDQENSRDNQKPKNTKNTKEKKSKTIPGISKWFEWSWPVAGQFAGYVRARSLPHIGKWIDFSPAQIANLCGTVYRPSPTVSEPTEPNTPWIMPNPSIKTDSEFPINEVMNEIVESQAISLEQEFPLKKGWALKENLKLGNKGGGKRISKKVVQYLQGYFLAGNLRAADRYSPENMHTCLEELAAEGELTLEEIPTVKTIKGWIGRYSANFKKEASEKALVENMESNQSGAVAESSIRPNKRQKKG